MFQLLFLGICTAEPLTLEYCIKTALENNPDLAASSSRIDSRKASVGQAASDGRLKANAGANYTRNDSSTAADDTGAYSTSLTIEQSVYDWGRTSLKVTGAKLNTDAAKGDYLAARDTLIAEVRAAYYGLNSSVRQNEVARTRYDNYKKRLTWAKSYYEVGTKAKIEVTKAESDLASSKLALVRTESSAEQYKAQLASAMGQPLMVINDVTDVLSYEEWTVSIESAVERAISNRPDLAAQQDRVKYARTALELEKKGMAPSISASAGYNLSGSTPFDENGWNAKLSLSVPLIDGGLTKSKIEGAAADLITANAQMESLSNSVMLEVRKAWQALREAKEALNASIEAERQAKETYILAEGRYKAGVGDNLEISDAVDSYASAQANTVLSLYECKKAQLDLEKAMGGLE